MENKKEYSFEDLINALKNPEKEAAKTLPNTAETWSRIKAKDSFNELNMGKDELASFLSEWCKENNYNNI